MSDAKVEESNETTDVIDEKAGRPFNTKVIIAGILILAAIAASVFFAFQFVEDEKKRDLHSWQIRLGIVADSRTAALNEWISNNFRHLRELADNASLQLYVTELAMGNDGPSQELPAIEPLEGLDGEPLGLDGQPPVEEEQELRIEETEDNNNSSLAQATFLRTLLTVTAERTGFAAPQSNNEVNANVERVGVAGIGIVDKDGIPLVSSPGMPPATGRIKDAALKAMQGDPVIIDAYIGASGKPTMGFALPIFALQGDETKGIGAVIGIRIIGDDLFKTLVQPGELEKTAETYLVRLKDKTVEYLSPLADGTQPLKRSLATDTPELAAYYAVETPGGFALKRDYLGEEVLVTSRALAEIPWVLVRKVTTKEAMAATQVRTRTILIVLILIIAGVTITLVAVWRHGSSMRATQAAQNFKLSSERFENLSRFMNLVTNSLPTTVAAVDADTVYTFANKLAADEAGIAQEDIIGKTMAAVMGPIKAGRLSEINAEVIKAFMISENVDEARQTHILEFGSDEDGDVQVLKTDHIPLRGDRDHKPGVLMILEDITELTAERKRSEQMLRELIDTLVSVVDRRDPFSTFHSTRVSEVSRAIATEMGMEEQDIKTVDIAGNLMNLGKIIIPKSLLTKTGDLTDEERDLITHAYLASVDILQNVTFEGPVVQSIREMGETWDGKGPIGLEGDNIIKTARILAVANAFVGMVSARAYRDAMPFEKASNFLLQDSGSKFDRKPVSALINYLENRGGLEDWAHFREKPAILSPEDPLE